MKPPPPPGIDRISALPDEMLIHILSFLPTTSAFTTTVLSKRWTPLCHSLTALNFDDDEGVQDFLRFCCIVDAVLLSPSVQHHQPIQTFRLKSWWLDCHACHVGEWMEAAIRRGVENLELSNSSTLTWNAPFSPSIFTSQTLVVLKLNGFHMRYGDSGSVDLPSLRTLHLTMMSFRLRKEFMKFLSGCPNLVDLNAPVSFPNEYYNDNRGWKTMPKLEKACISELEVPFTVIYNVQFLRIEKMERMAKDKYINSYYAPINSYYTSMPVFQNLINIELCFYLLPDWDRVVEVLPFCPKLQTLVIEKKHRTYCKEKWAYTESVPECVLLHLRTCSIGIYQGMYDDFDFAAYIMQNARLLQVMTLHSGPYTKESKKDQFFKQLSRCPRISPTCKLFLDTKEIPTRT